MTTTSDGKTNRRSFRFSLRSLLVVMLLASITLHWLLEVEKQVEEQRGFAAWVRGDKEGRIYYDYQIRENGLLGRNAAPLLFPSFYDYLYDVAGVNLAMGPPVRNVSRLAGQKQLRRLSISVSPACDLTPLAELKDLKSLGIFNSQISDLAALAELKHLELVTLSATQVSDIKPLAVSRNLRCLRLADSPVSDITPLAELQSLESLILQQTQVCDLAPLAGLHNLTELILHQTPVSDVAPLAGLNNLRELSLKGTLVSKEDCAKLQSKLPNCRIYYE